MAIHTFRCAHCPTLTPKNVALLAGLERVVSGQTRLAYALRRGNLIYEWGHWHSLHLTPISNAPMEHTCRLCGQNAVRVVSRSRFYLRADGSQGSGWSSPGMCGINYDKTKARHLRDQYGANLRMSQRPEDNPGIKQVQTGRRLGLVPA